ncbi:MAG: hypothetical protein Q9201_005795 [Fulgogasparrea decipioides]
MPDEMEPSILEYARYYGLCQNHLEVKPLDLVPSPDVTLIQQHDEDEWLQLDSRITTPPPERLVAVKEASILLSATNPKQYDGCNFEGFDPIPTHRVHNLKVELPLLRSDHEVDMLGFAHRIEPNLTEEFMPLETLDDELDQGLGWPSSCHALPEMFFQKAQNEKLEVAKEVIEYMKAAMETRVHGEAPTFDYEWAVYRKNIARDPLTPPLLPRSPSPQPFEPSSDTGRLELLSDHSSPTRHEIMRIDRELFEREALSPVKRRLDRSNDEQARTPDTDVVGGLFSPLKDIHHAPSPPPPKRKRIQDLKVEGPLTPPLSDQPPPWETRKVSFSDTLQEFIPSLELPVPEPEQTSTEDFDKLFAEQIAPLAAKAERAIEQEQLQEADTTTRVSVPILDFTKSPAPWNVSLSGDNGGRINRFLCDIKEKYLKLPPWRIDGHIWRELSWIPFPSSLGRFELKEIIEDDGSLTAFITQPEAIDLDDLTQKRPGLRILDDVYESEEEELEYGTFPEANNVDALVKKRTIELQDGSDEDSAASGRIDVTTERKIPSRRMESGRRLSQPYRKQTESLDESLTSLPPAFSAIGALDAFLGVRTGRMRKSNEREDGHALAPTLKPSIEELGRDELTAPKIGEEAALTTPAPKLRVPTYPRSFVASTTFLSNRRLAREVQNLYPSANIIERDFALYNPQPAHPASRTHLPRKAPDILSDEADLILSPSTGLILTTLQKIKQQSLPGQAIRSPVHERIQRTAARYERLIVIVSRANTSSNGSTLFTSNLDGSDCEAIASFTALLKHLPTLSESELLLADGDTGVLATWIVSLMANCSSDLSVNLLQEETQWEVFLRQAGMNAFAAQVVLAGLKSTREEDVGTWGLRKFVLMSPQERCQRFEAALGGRGILDRVGKVLDACW